MRASIRVYVISALALVAASPIAVSPCVGQGAAVADLPGSAPAGTRTVPAARADDREGRGTFMKGKEIESVLGREVRTRVEEDMGRIIDLLADRDGQVQAAVIEFGGFLGIGTRKIAIEWSALRFETEGKQAPVVLEMTRDQLRRAPEYRPSEPAVLRRAVQ